MFVKQRLIHSPNANNKDNLLLMESLCYMCFAALTQDLSTQHQPAAPQQQALLYPFQAAFPTSLCHTTPFTHACSKWYRRLACFNTAHH